MNKCLRINITVDITEDFLHNFIQKNARKFDLEGSAKIVDGDNQFVVIVCGEKDNIDSFLDVLHKGSSKCVPELIEVEPFLKDRDYRGVFRVIE